MTTTPHVSPPVRRAGRPVRALPAPPPELPTPGLPAMADAANQVAAAEAVIMDASDVLRQAGRIEGLEFIRRVGDIAIAQTFIKIKESNKYKGIPYHDETGNLRRIEGLDEFCRVFLGKSYTRCFELAQNLHLLGSELYEQTERIDFRAKDYAALKALPADDQLIVKQALESDSREAVIDLLQELAAKAQREKEAATRQIAELKGSLAAKDQVLQRKSRELLERAEELAKRDLAPHDSQEQERLQRLERLHERLHLAATRLLGQAAHFSQAVANLLVESAEAEEQDVINRAVTFAFQGIADLARRHRVPVDFARVVSPPWQTEEQP